MVHLPGLPVDERTEHPVHRTAQACPPGGGRTGAGARGLALAARRLGLVRLVPTVPRGNAYGGRGFPNAGCGGPDCTSGPLSG